MSTSYDATSGAGLNGARNGLGIAALVLGILAVLGIFTVILVPLSLILGIVAIVLGVIGRKRAKRGEATNGGMALAGLILGVVATVLSIGVLVLGGIGLSQLGGIDSITECSALETQAEQEECLLENAEN